MSRSKMKDRRGGGSGGQGWKGNRGKGSRGRGGSHPQGRSARWAYSSRSEIERTNENMEEYYNTLNLVPEENERKDFWEAMKSDLPNSFRFAGSRGHALAVQRRLINHYIPEITAVEYEGQPVSPPKPVEWYPDQLAWSMTTPKNVIRKFPPFASFQKFLVSENSIGNITRQEIVSMIPPLMLDIKPGMTVLDLCAAPGSKSAQIIEMVHGGEEARVRKVLEEMARQQGRELSPEGVEARVEKEQAASEDDWADDGRPTGLLIANDVDYRRAHMLTHQCKRLNSPNIIVTNHDATLFPSIRLPSESGNKYIKFDRVLADVPCTGDGTTRKNVEIWKSWSQVKALGIHNTQVRILVRALQVLKVGGRVVYSTCSLNPIENEAVVAAAIHRCGGSDKVQVVDKDEALPGLRTRPGLTSWQVLDKAGRWWTTWDQVTAARDEQGEDGMSRLAHDMFPPDADLALDRCIRVYPHLQDTGGFFIAVLEKKSEIKARPENTVPAIASATKGSVASIANEIKQRGEQDGNELQKLDNLDSVVPPHTNLESNIASTGAQAVARQNQDKDEQIPDGAPDSPSLKRPGDEIAMTAATKRLKTRNEEEDDPTPNDQADRQVHYPRPPTADLALAEHEAPNSTSQSATADNHQPSNNNGARKGKHPNQSQEESFIFLSPDHEALASIQDFYDISPRFPKDRYMVRNPAGIPTKSIYYTSSLARDILQANEGTGLKLVHCGVKMFVKQETHGLANACKWRIQAEGLPIVEPWVGETRVVRLSDRKVLKRLLKEMFPKVSRDGWAEFGAIETSVKKLEPGCAVLRVEVDTDLEADETADLHESRSGRPKERLVMPLWRGLASLNLMLPKEDRKAMLLRLFNDDSPLVDHSKEQQLRQQQEQHQQQKDVVASSGEKGDDNGRSDDTSEAVAERDAKIGAAVPNGEQQTGDPVAADTHAQPLKQKQQQQQDEDEDEEYHVEDEDEEGGVPLPPAS